MAPIIPLLIEKLRGSIFLGRHDLVTIYLSTYPVVPNEMTPFIIAPLVQNLNIPILDRYPNTIISPVTEEAEGMPDGKGWRYRRSVMRACRAVFRRGHFGRDPEREGPETCRITTTSVETGERSERTQHRACMKADLLPSILLPWG